MPLSLDHRMLAVIGLAGVLLNLFGSLYLAYDLLGGPRGPLRSLTEVITYVVVSLGVSIGSYLVLFDIVTQFHFRIVVVLGHDVAFAGVLGLGIGSGLGTGLGYSLSLGARTRYAAPRKPNSYGHRLTHACIIGAVTGLFGIGIYLAVAATENRLHSIPAALVTGLIYNVFNGLVLGTLVARLLVRKAINLHPTQKPEFDWLSLQTGLISGLIIGVLVGFGYWPFFGPDPSIGLGGLVGGILGGLGLGGVVGSAAQVEWWIDHLPDRRLGTFGIILILGGLALDALQYLVNLFGVPVR